MSLVILILVLGWIFVLVARREGFLGLASLLIGIAIYILADVYKWNVLLALGGYALVAIVFKSLRARRRTK